MYSSSRTLLFAFTMALFVRVTHHLTPGGMNVCSRTYSVTAYVYESRSRTAQQRYYVSCGWWGKRCARTRFYTVYYSQKVSATQYKKHYYCCGGWSSTGSECRNAICSPSCRYGVCYAPNRCRCHSGWKGTICDTDIDECKNNPCNQECKNLKGSYACTCKIGFTRVNPNPKHRECKDIDECKKHPCTCAPGSLGCNATCNNTIGSFRCSCSKGYQLINGKVCADVNECKISGMNGCKHNCHNSLGSYFCSCRKGYHLASDNRSCIDNDECRTLNGGCEQTCTNLPGSHKCSCKVGFVLAWDSRNCLDVDECKSKRPCDRINGFCRNLRGTYECGCNAGYNLAADKRSCVDIDECRSKSTNKCDQRCHNTDGSYFCSCRVGYLREGNTSCRDIDECKQGFHGCHHHCYNTPGSFYCGCRKGYKELPDGKHCQALPCQSLSNPQDGVKECTGQVTDKYCLFVCKRGFQLLGSSNRTCTPSSTWSGEKVYCRRKKCTSPIPPKHGGITVPCHHDYASTCSLKCSRDYYLVGQEAIKCDVNDTGSPFWSINATCKAVEACNPNPCKHGGRCLITGRNTFRCLCERTDYRGVTCEEGYLQVPSFSRLTVAQLSGEFEYRATPVEYIKVTITAKDNKAIVQPSSLHFSKSVTARSVRILASTAGKIELSYKLYGEGVLYFTQPEDTVLYAEKSTALQNPIELIPSSLTSLCHFHTLSKCNDGNVIQLVSSCPWTNTAGYKFISVKSKGRSFPVSLAGISITSFPSSTYLSPEELIKRYLVNQKLIPCDSSERCKHISSSQVVSFALSSNLFNHAYQEKFSQITPTWLHLELVNPEKYSNDFQPNDIFSRLGVSSDFPDIFDNQFIKNASSQLYSVFKTSKRSFLRLLSTKKTIGGSATYYLASSLCDSSVLLKLDSQVSVKDELLSAGFVGLKEFAIYQLGFGNYKKVCANSLEQSVVKQRCLMPGMFSNASVLVHFDQKSQLELNGRFMFSSSASEKLLFAGLAEPQESVFYGSHFSNYTMHLKSGAINLIATDNETQGYIQLGGPTGSSLAYLKDGISLKLKASSLKLTYTSPAVTLKPDSSHIHIKYLYEAKGGNVLNIHQREKLIHSLKSIKAVVNPLFPNIKKSLGSQYDQDYNPLQKKASEVVKYVKQILNRLEEGSSFKEAYSSTLILKSKYLEFSLAVSSFRKRLEGNALLKTFDKMMGLQLFYLKKIDEFEVSPFRTGVMCTFKGLQVNFNGRICVHKLCFNGMITDMDSQRIPKNCKNCGSIPQNKRFDGMSLKGSVFQETQLNTRIRLVKGDNLFLQHASLLGTFSGNFTATAHLFGNDYHVLFKIVDDKLLFTIPNVLINGLLRFNVQGKYVLSEVTWETLLQRIQGNAVSEDKGALLDHVQREMQSYFSHTGNYTAVRLKHSKAIINESQVAMKSLEIKSQLLSDRIKNSSESVRISRLWYNRQLTLLKRYQTTYSSYGKDITKFVEKSLDSLCKFQRCNATCVSMPIKKICQDPVYSTVTLKECQEVADKVATQVVEQYKTLCEVKIKQFQLVYTGSCAENPAKRAQRKAMKSQALEAAGTGIGTVIGFFFGGSVGAKIGGAIGGAIGKLLGLFGGCDETYEEYETSYTKQEPCTKLKESVHFKEYRYSECFSVEKKLPSGYSQPRVCGITNHSCIAVISDPACVVANTRCQKHRSDFLSRNQSIPKSYSDTYASLQKAETNLLVALSDMRRLEIENKIHREEYAENTILLRRERKRHESAVQGHKVMVQNIASDICLHQFYELSPIIKNHLTIKMFSIDVSLPIIDNIQVEVHFDNIRSRQTKQTSFLAEFQDPRGYLKVATKNIIYEGLCSPKRKRRTASTTLRETLPFVSWYNEAQQNTSKQLLACLTFKRAYGYLHRVANYTIESANSWGELDRELRRAKNDTSKYKMVESANEFITSQLQQIYMIDSYLNSSQSGSNVSQLLNEWKANGEIFTRQSNNSVCFNLEDCLNVAIDSIRNLPLMLSINQAEYQSTITTIEDIVVNKIFQASTIRELKDIAISLRTNLERIRKVHLVCSKRPQVSINLKGTVNVTVKSKIELVCHVQSDLPVKIFWIKDNKLVEGEHKQALLLNVKRSSKGFYKCRAISLAGNGSSNGTLLIVEHAPQFLEQPQNVIHWMPSPSFVRLFLVCNGTGNPEPKVRWYYLSYNGSYPVAILSNRSIFLPTPHHNASGYLYCELHNSVGKIKSKRVTLDFVYQYAADQELHLTFKFNVKKETNSSDISSSGINGTQGNDYSGNVSFSDLKLRMESYKGINVTYIVSGDSRTQSVKFVLSSKPRTWPNGSKPENYFKFASKSRQNLANSASFILSDIIANNSVITADNDKLIAVDSDSMELKYYQNCLPGYSVKPNGFVCGQCLPGSHEQNGKCLFCPIGTYQPLAGQRSCVECPDSKTTSSMGSTGLSFCMYPNLCNMGKHNCHRNAECTMQGATFNCKCKAGFTGSGTECNYIDLCPLVKSKCHQDAVCISNGPTFHCQCRQGFTGNGFNCSPRDLCRSGLHNCHEDAKCINDGSGYQCQCKSGFSGNGTSCFPLTKKGKSQGSIPRVLIYGSAGGGVALVIILVVIVVLCRRNRKSKETKSAELRPQHSFSNQAYEHEANFAVAQVAQLEDEADAVHYAHVATQQNTPYDIYGFHETSA